MQSENSNFTEKERNIIKYISGYVMKTLYCRLRKSTVHRSDTNIKHMSILLAGKDTCESSTTDDDKFINAKNRGGLWKVSPGVLNYFLLLRNTLELMLQIRKEKLMFSLWCQLWWWILVFYLYSQHLEIQQVKKQRKEISLNLLQSMITLYLRARTFKYVSP